MLANFRDVIDKAKKSGKVTIAVAVALDTEVLQAIKQVHELGLANALLVGDAELIRPLYKNLDLNGIAKIIHEPDMEKAALKAAMLVHNGEAHILMKGLVNSSIFLRAALDKEVGLRSGNILCHFAAFEIPGEKKLAFHVDGGMNIAPTLNEKKQILKVSLEVLKTIGIEKPNVAVLTANEQVNPKMPATVDAKELADMWKKNEFSDCVIEGPIAMDVAASSKAAHDKGINSQIAGNVDLFLMPTIEAGNFVGKTLVHYAKAKIGGVIIGATHPIVLVSRSDNTEAKVNSIALACLIADRK
jgi:phosphate butyryltransferase